LIQLSRGSPRTALPSETAAGNRLLAALLANDRAAGRERRSAIFRRGFQNLSYRGDEVSLDVLPLAVQLRVARRESSLLLRGRVDILSRENAFLRLSEKWLALFEAGSGIAFRLF